MRQVPTPNFCKVCIEGLWMSLLRRVDFVDDITTGCTLDARRHVSRIAELQLVPLAEFRTERVNAPHDSYTIVWTKDGDVLDEFTNKTTLVVGQADADARFAVDVTYATDEIRVDKDGLLSTRWDIAFPQDW